MKNGFVLFFFIAGALIFMFACEADQQASITIPEGTQMTIAVSEKLSTETDESGEEFMATMSEDIIINDTLAIPSGARVSGQLTEIQAPGNVSKKARMTLEFQEVMGPNGNYYNLNCPPVKLEAGSGTRSDLETLAAGTVIGAVIGGLAKGGEGAAVGAAVGAGAGGAIIIATKGDHLKIPEGQKFKVQTTAPSKIPIASERQ